MAVLEGSSLVRHTSQNGDDVGLTTTVGNLLVVFVTADDDGILTFDTPAGWTQAGIFPGNLAGEIQMYRALATGGPETFEMQNVSVPGDRFGYMAMIEFSGIEVSGSFSMDPADYPSDVVYGTPTVGTNRLVVHTWQDVGGFIPLAWDNSAVAGEDGTVLGFDEDEDSGYVFGFEAIHYTTTGVKTGPGLVPMGYGSGINGVTFTFGTFEGEAVVITTGPGFQPQSRRVNARELPYEITARMFDAEVG